MKPTELLEALKIGFHAAIDHIRNPEEGVAGGMPFLIVSPPGCGKSDIVAQACREMDINLIISHPVVSDPVDYKGLPFVVEQVDGEKVAEFMPFGELLALMQATEPTVFFLDDLGQAPQSVQAACMQLLLARRINGHRISDYVIFVAATNRREDKAGVRGVLEPVKSRFVSILNLEPDLEDWIKWAQETGQPPEVPAFVQFAPEMLHNFEASKDMVNSPSPRTNHNVCKLLRCNVPEHLEFEMISGAAGQPYAAKFLGFIRTWRSLPDPRLTLQNPDSVDIPSMEDDPAVMYALCGAVAHIVEEDTMGNFIKFANRLPAEFSVLTVRAAILRDSSLVETEAFISWAANHSNVVL